MRSMKIKLTLAALLFSPMLALAHHGFDMFDFDKTLTLKGTIKEWQWTNPHSWIQLNVEEKGVVTEWSLEGSSISQLARRGWKRNSLKPGDQVVVTVHPLKNGKPGGQWAQVSDTNGKVLGTNDVPGAGGRGPGGPPPAAAKN